MALGAQEQIERNSMPVTECGCWIWLKHLNHKGYGITVRGGRTQRAHRLSWAAYRGEIPHGLLVLHRCDVPACVNPDHLFLGDNAANTRDCIAKGRFKPKAARRKTTAASVAEIQKAPGTYRMLANKYGLCVSSIGKIKRGVLSARGGVR